MLNAARRKPSYEAKRRQNLKTKYGLSIEAYDAMLEGQGGVCAICHRKESRGLPLAVDHDHRDGLIRGLLCTACNLKLDWAVQFSERIASYLAECRRGS